jgi:ribosomal protein S18 acetylase RimI-like enzyme
MITKLFNITDLLTLPSVGEKGVKRLLPTAEGAPKIVLLSPDHAEQSYKFHEQIRDLSPDDKKHYLKDYDLDFFRNNAIIGVLVHNRLAGQAVIHMGEDGGSTLQALSVHPVGRGHNISNDLIAAGIAYATSNGATHMSARVKVDNPVTQGIFEQNGFRRQLEADHNEGDPKQSAYIYERTLMQNRDPQISMRLRMRGTALWSPSS